MGNTVLQSQILGNAGLLLLESFESVDFASDQGWTLLNGTPTLSSVVAFDGLHSLEMDTSYPQLEKNCGIFHWSAGYFFDDASQQSTAFTPFISWLNSSGGNEYALGVDNSVSTSHYTMIVGGGASATTVARADGWHRFEYYHDIDDGTLKLLIDGTPVLSTTVLGINQVLIRVGARAYTGSPAFGFFDLIQVTKNPFITVKTIITDGIVTAFDPDGVLVASGSSQGGSAKLDVSLVNQPFNGFIKVKKADGLRPYFRGPTLSLSAGDLYTVDVFDLGRRLASFTRPRMRMADNKESSSGKDQTLFYFSRDQVSFTFTDLTDSQMNELERWWGHAAQGNQFSAAIDNDEVWESYVSGASQIGGLSGITVASSHGLNKDSKILVVRGNGEAFESAEVLSVIPGIVSFVTTKKPMLNFYNVFDPVRHIYYWPFCVTTDASFTPVLTNTKLKRWSVTIGFKEAL